MLKNICITGEISNFKRHVSGHWYFTLKDEEAAINCVMFRQAAHDACAFSRKTGMSVRLTGSVSLYVKYRLLPVLRRTAWSRKGWASCICASSALKQKLAG